MTINDKIQSNEKKIIRLRTFQNCIDTFIIGSTATFILFTLMLIFKANY